MTMQIETGLPKISVRHSGIHGTGVYAAEPIAKGRRIIEYTGEKISKEEGDRRAETNNYILILNDNWDLDGTVGGNDSRFVNHSCSPNTDIVVDNERAWIVAIRDIEEGEELSFDYDFEKDDSPVKCRCGSPECRGYIVKVAEE